MEIAVLALGCFWGPEIKFSKIEGVIKTEVGYCGGNSLTTTYKEVCTGKTNHAEVVKLDFDEKIITYEKIIKIELLEYIREEKRFETVDDLIKRLKLDREKCLKLIH